MKIIKKNQIIILVIALMLVSAGYLNYTANNKENTIPTSIQEDNSEEYASIGDAKLVSGNAISSENIIQDIVPNETQENSTNSEIVSNNDTNNTTTQTSNNVDEYFSSSRLSRDKMYSQMLESYQNILESQTISNEQKSIAQNEIKNINDIKNKIMICENLIKTKEINDLIIFVNDKSISVVVKSDKLESEQIAQIQNIISREMVTDIDNIHISNK